MRLLTAFTFFIVLFIRLGSEAAFAQPSPDALQTSSDATSDLTWKATLMTGDDQLGVFDNARKALRTEFLQMGLTPGNIKELSMSRAERNHGSLPSTVRNLADALRDLSVGDRDACLIHMTSHGSPQGFYMRNGPVITPKILNTILDDACGARPTVVLISACYSGVFVSDVMLKPNRIILTAARQDRTSFGCSAENQYTYWDGCLIDSLPKGDSWKSLYGAVQRCVESKEHQGHFIPSFPQAYFGKQVADLKIPNVVIESLSVAKPRQDIFWDGNADVLVQGSTGDTPAFTVKREIEAPTKPPQCAEK